MTLHGLLVLALLASSSWWKGAQGFDLSINVEVDPPGAYLGENRFLAAAGPITVECLPVKANGTVTFEWSSTCEACPFINSTLSTIVIPYLTSDVTGNHTCNATDESGESKEATLEFNVVGAGIHVSNGASISVGYHRNNSVLVSTDDSADYRLRFYCLSGSDLYEQGELLGLDGKTITSDTFFNTTNEEPGSLVVMNSAAGGQEEITQSEQGVYTCRISDETGELREVGIGIYPAGFSLPPKVDIIDLKIKPQGSVLTCTSTGSPATNIEWMKDGQLLTIEGVYSETQTIVDRAAATYDNVLIIDDKDSNVFGSTYTCSVNNVLGSDKQSLKIEKPTQRPHGSGKTEAGVIAGVVVSLVVTALIIAAIITVACFYTKRRRQNNKEVVTEERLALKMTDSSKPSTKSYQSLN